VVDHCDAARAHTVNLYSRTFGASPSKVGRICGEVIERSRLKYPALGLVSDLTLPNTKRT